MPLSRQASDVVSRPLPQDKIKQRPGKGGMTFNYISADLVIELLNEAFEHNWSTRIVSSVIHGETAVVGLELTVQDAEGGSIWKQQFGSCEISRGMGPGEAFKGAASDALKKAATLLGIGLELYQDDDSATGAAGPRLPQTASKPAGPNKPDVPSVPGVSKPAVAPPPREGPRTTVPRPPSPPKPGNPFANGTPSAATSAPVPKPSAPSVPQAAPAAPKVNPFASATTGDSGPNSTQMNAMVNLSTRKNLSQPEMIALAKITDGQGNPVQVFDELTHSQAIQVIKAAQL